MKITIKDKNIELKYTIRAMLMFENIADKTFNASGLTDVITFMYCCVLASCKDYSITFDEFIDYLDENPSVINEFGDWIQDIIKTQNSFKKK